MTRKEVENALPKQAMERFPLGIQEFANAFAAFQEARHKADYSLFGKWDKLHALEAIDKPENAINQFE